MASPSCPRAWIPRTSAPSRRWPWRSRSSPPSIPRCARRARTRSRRCAGSSRARVVAAVDKPGPLSLRRGIAFPTLVVPDATETPSRMPYADFVHLAVHSAYSLSEGAMKTKTLIELARREAMPALGVADTGNLFGALELALAAADAGIQPVVGCRLAIRRAEGGMRGGRPVPPDRLVLIAQTDEGWLNLMHLVSAAYLETEGAETPQVALDRVERHAAGLIALSGGPGGPVGRLLVDGQEATADAMAGRLAQ